MRSILIGLFALLLAFPAFSQENKDILLEVGNEKVTAEEFLHIYSKNNRNQELSFSYDSLSSYMDLFVNFKLKVVEAKSMGLDTLKSFNQELKGYRSQLAQPYLTDKTVEEELIQEAYGRSKWDVNASHILLKVDPTGALADTLKIFEKANMIREKLLAGEDFETLARKYSDDESVRYNNGNLGYFTVFGMVYPFETAAYNTNVGEISNVIRTRFGYHILKVNDKRPAKGRIHVAHIMVLTPKGATEEQKQQAEERVAMIQAKLDSGEKFEDLAIEFSEDRRSGKDGGMLPWFGVGGKMIPEFENAAYQLNEIGEVSNALRTSYGYHFIKLVDREPIGTFEEQKAKLKNRISNSARASRSKDVLVNRLMKEYNAKVYVKALDELAEKVTDSIFYGTWDATKALNMKEPLFSFADQTFTQADFAKYLRKFNRKAEPQARISFINRKFEGFKEKMILMYEEDNLENKYTKFRYLMKEYHDGILLFDVTDKMVWSKAVKDSTGLEGFYKIHCNEYMWKTRYKTHVISVSDKKVRKSVLKYMKKNPDTNWENIDSLFNATDSLAVVKEHWTVFEQEESSFADDLALKYASKLNKKGRVILCMDDERILDMSMIEASPKKLDEARGIITADYQNYLEKEWIKALHEKYNVNIHQDILKKLSEK